MSDVSETLTAPSEGGDAGCRRRLTVAAVVATIGAVAGLVTTVSAGVLAAIYRPHGEGFERWARPGDLNRVDTWTDVHDAAVLVLIGACVLTAGLVVRGKLNSPTWLRRHVVAGVASVVAAFVAWYTTALVQWDQLALWAVTVGGDIDGYWSAAFGGGIRFVLVGNSEVSQTTYATALGLHLATPAVATAGLGYLVRPSGRNSSQPTG